MSDLAVTRTPAAAAAEERRPTRSAPASAPIAYAVPLLLVACATLLAFVARNVISAPNLTLIYVLPVVIAATAFGWGPALEAALVGVLAFDFFFTEPFHSFDMANPSDVWAAALLLATAAIVASVAAQSRQRAEEAARAREQAESLQGLAHLVVEQRPQAEVLEAAAQALRRTFQAPAVIFLEEAGRLRRAADAGAPEISAADEEAARAALSAGLHTRAQSYPFDQARFEFWAVAAPTGPRFVLGVDFTRAERGRPEAPERFTDALAAYVAAGLAGWAACGGAGATSM